MFNIADLPDMKYLRIEDSESTFTLNQTRTLEHIGPPDRLCFIDFIGVRGITAAASFQVTSLMIDDVEMLQTSTAALVQTRIYFFQDMHEFDTLPTQRRIRCMIPFRRIAKITIVNAAAAGDVEWTMYAYVHQDRKREFQTVATLQGQ